MNKKLISIGTLGLMTLLSAMALAAPETPSPKQIFFLSDKPSDTPFSPAIKIDNILFVSGMLATNPESGSFEGGTIVQQAERVILNIEILLKKAGFSLADVVQATVYIVDFNEFGDFNTVFKKFFQASPPTRATVQVAKLARDAKIEISAVAMK